MNNNQKQSAHLQLIFGGQWGSEGKGKVAAFLAAQMPEDHLLYAVRVGGPNAGHSIYDVKGNLQKLQSIPCAAFVRQRVVPVIGAGAVIIPTLLADEIKRLVEIWGPSTPTIYIDKNATVITDWDMKKERHLKGSIGSTGEGVGAATAAKVMRSATTMHKYLEHYRNYREDPCSITDSEEDRAEMEHACTILDDEQYGLIMSHVAVVDTVRHLNLVVREYGQDTTIQIEGTQGYGLSLNVSGYYPFTTSRDCTPEALMSQVGLSFRAFDPEKVRVIGVVRTYPIRVGGNSGPLPREITWDYLSQLSEGYVKEPERTTVTKKIRRIAELDFDCLRQMVEVCEPTELALMFLDYKYPTDAGKARWTKLSAEGKEYIQMIEDYLGVAVTLAGTGFASMAGEMVDTGSR